MREIAPGLVHWTAFHPNIGADVSSYYVVAAGVVIDPKLPDGGFDAIAEHGRPRQIVLTSGNHTRDAAAFAAEYDAPIRVSPEGAERIAGALAVELYADGEDVVPGVRAIRVGELSGDEYALHLTAAPGASALALADGLIRYGEAPGFVPDKLIGENPEAVKAGLVERFAALLELDFEHLLFAHGEPIAGRGKAALRDFVEARGA
jgi:hypothetical protein